VLCHYCSNFPDVGPTKFNPLNLKHT
jgi:hypothetical protein